MSTLPPPDPAEQPPTPPPDSADDIAGGVPLPGDDTPGAPAGGDGGTAATSTTQTDAGAAGGTPDGGVAPPAPLSGTSAATPAPQAAASDQQLQQQLGLLLAGALPGTVPVNSVVPPADGSSSNYRGENDPLVALPYTSGPPPPAAPPPPPVISAGQPGSDDWANPYPPWQSSDDDWANPYPPWPSSPLNSDEGTSPPVSSGPQPSPPQPGVIGVSGGTPDAGYAPPPPGAPDAGLPISSSYPQPGTALRQFPPWSTSTTNAWQNASAVGTQASQSTSTGAAGQPHPPEFLILSGGFSWVLGVTGSVTLTNDENLYFGIGPSLGTPGGGASLTGGWMGGGGQKSPQKVNSFVHGLSYGLSGMLAVPMGPAGAVELGNPGGDLFDPSSWALEAGGGVGTPGFQAQVTYSFGPIHLGSSTAGDPVYDPPSGPPAYDPPFPWL
jgi:hypothetical protein